MSRLLNNLLFTTLLMGVVSCTQFSGDFQPKDTNFSVPEYVSQVEIITQEFVSIPSPYDPLSSVAFAYDRNRDRNDKAVLQTGRRGIDLIEVKLFNRTGHWNWYPILIVSDDTFDGFVDRLFLDDNLDGRLDKVSNVRMREILIEQIRFNDFQPWQVINKQKKIGVGDNLAFILWPQYLVE